MNILEVLRNTNLGDGTYNIVGVTWFGMTMLLTYWFYSRCNHNWDRMVKGILFGFVSALFLHLLTDEINLWVFAMTRTNVLAAIRQYWTIPDKIPRLALILINYKILRSKYGNFKYHWDRRGLLVIIGATTAYAILSITTGMYGWEITDPTNLGKYFYTYVLYYIALFIWVLMFYPNWRYLSYHIWREHPRNKRDGKTRMEDWR